MLRPVINQAIQIDVPSESPSQPRAVGTADLSVGCTKDGMTRIKDLRQSGSMKLVFPHTYRSDMEAVLVNTAGGITGGDRFSFRVDVGANAALTITTQAAERAYRAQKDEIGRVDTKISVKSGGRLNWLPQELILFERSALQRRLTLDLGAEGRLLMVEPVVFGRAAMPEVLRDVRFQDRIKITRAGVPIYVDGVDFSGDVTAQLARPAVANGAGAMASVVMVDPDAQSHLNPVRAMLGQSAGASLLAEDVLVIRLLAKDSFELRATLVPVLNHLTQNTLPISWRL